MEGTQQGWGLNWNTERHEKSKVRLMFYSGRMETPFTQIGKTGTGWAEEKRQINFLWKCEEICLLILKPNQLGDFLIIGSSLLRDPSH